MTDDARQGLPWMKIGIGVLAVAALFAAYSFLPVQEWMESFRAWIEELGPLGWAIFIVAYALACLVLFPGSLLTLAAGVAWGLWGFPLVVVGATIGAGLAFLAGRYFAQERVEKMIADRPKLRAVNAAIEEEGWKTVGLLRLSPAVPFSLQNWVLGATSVGFVPYILATFFGIMPGSLLYVWIGSLGGEAGSGGGSTAKYAFFAIGILATLVVTILVGRKARQKLEEHGVAEA